MGLSGVLGRLPEAVLPRAVTAGLLSAGLLELPVRFLLQASGIDVIALHHAVLLRVVITVPMSLVIVPLVILAALADVRERPALAAV